MRWYPVDNSAHSQKFSFTVPQSNTWMHFYITLTTRKALKVNVTSDLSFMLLLL